MITTLVRQGLRAVGGRHMHVVIFRATILNLDAQYATTAARMRELAFKQFGCIEFQSVIEGATEISISYWPSEEHIQAWKAHPEHMLAQQLGKTLWYLDYSVEVAEVVREYRSSSQESQI